MEKKEYVTPEVSFVELRIEERLAMCGFRWQEPSEGVNNCWGKNFLSLD